NLFIVNMVVAMGLALGIDYSLFIIARLRDERHHGAGTREAILTVSSTATRAVVFSGSAFALAMIAMLLVPDTTLRSLGLGAVMRRPAVSLVATTVILLALASPVLGLQMGAAGTSSLPDDTVAKQGLLA